MRQLPTALAAGLLGAVSAGMALASAAAANDQPSFDCSADKLSYAEQAICDDPVLAWHDRLMDKQYSAIRQGEISDDARNALREEQRAWLKLRESCGDLLGKVWQMNQCIQEAYQDRSIELGQRFTQRGDALNGRFGWEREYEYNGEEIYNGGYVNVWLVSSYEAAATVNVVMGPTFHTCWYSGSLVLNEEGTLAISELDLTDAEGDGLPQAALVLVSRNDGKELEVLTNNPQYYCGARARIDGLYPRQ